MERTMMRTTIDDDDNYNNNEENNDGKTKRRSASESIVESHDAARNRDTDTIIMFSVQLLSSTLEQDSTFY